MKPRWAVPAICLVLVKMLLAQAAISVSASDKTPSASTNKPKSYCASTSEVVGKEIVFTDCTGKQKRVPLENSQASPSDPKGERAASADEDPKTRSLRLQADQADYEYHVFSKMHAERTFTFQYWTGEVIFWVVLVIVFAGLALSAVQFYVGLRHPLESRTADGKSTKPDDASVTEFEASLQGIKLKSSVLGLLILAMSMVFFYLYLKYVYPITSISQ